MDHDVRAVLFDLDNTLSDRDEAFRRWARWFARDRLGLVDDTDVDDVVATFVLHDADGYAPRERLFQAIKERYPWLADDVESLVRRYRQQVVTHLPALDTGTAALLAALRDARVPWGIVTNGSSRNQRAKIAALNLDGHAHAIVISEEVGVSKPEPAIFRLAANRLGTAESEILFAGDHAVNDVAGAANVGMHTAWLHRGRTWPAELTEIAPDHVVDSLHDLMWIARRNGERYVPPHR